MNQYYALDERAFLNTRLLWHFFQLLWQVIVASKCWLQCIFCDLLLKLEWVSGVELIDMKLIIFHILAWGIVVTVSMCALLLTFQFIFNWVIAFAVQNSLLIVHGIGMYNSSLERKLRAVNAHDTCIEWRGIVATIVNHSIRRGTNGLICTCSHLVILVFVIFFHHILSHWIKVWQLILLQMYTTTTHLCCYDLFILLTQMHQTSLFCATLDTSVTR